MDNLLYPIGSIMAVILVIKSISAYKRTGQKNLLYAVGAFSLFGIFLFIEYLEHSLLLDNIFTDLMVASMVLGILLLFFLAVVKQSSPKRREQNMSILD